MHPDVYKSQERGKALYTCVLCGFGAIPFDRQGEKGSSACVGSERWQLQPPWPNATDYHCTQKSNLHRISADGIISGAVVE